MSLVGNWLRRRHHGGRIDVREREAARSYGLYSSAELVQGLELTSYVCQLQRPAVTIPTKDLTVAQGVSTVTNAVMGLPFALPLTASVFPHELLAATSGMAMSNSLALALPASSLPRLLHNTFRERH